eukprot:3619750-Rhodomonas_salina.1
MSDADDHVSGGSLHFHRDASLSLPCPADSPHDTMLLFTRVAAIAQQALSHLTHAQTTAALSLDPRTNDRYRRICPGSTPFSATQSLFRSALSAHPRKQSQSPGPRQVIIIMPYDNLISE